MKKFAFMAVSAIAAATLVSCGGAGTPSANLKSDVDTLSYALGMNLGEELVQYNIMDQMGVDSAFVNEFIKGMQDAASAKDDKKKMAYFVGVQIGNDLNNRIIPGMERQYFNDDSTLSLNRANMLAAIIKLVKGDTLTAIKADEARNFIQAFQTKMKEKQYADVKAEGVKFLAENAKKDSVMTTESGLQYKVIKQGTGAVPTETDKVKVHYEGRLIDGTVFDSSLERGEPTSFPVNGVIKGWTEALKMMPVGSEWEVYIPQELAYGENGAGQNIPPYATLIFKMQLLDIEK